MLTVMEREDKHEVGSHVMTMTMAMTMIIIVRFYVSDANYHDDDGNDGGQCGQ